MRRPFTAALGALALLFAVVGTASADSVTVSGSGPITSMFANNKQSAVLVKVYGDGGKNNVNFFHVKMRGTDGVTYTARAGWYGVDWITSLERGATLVNCPDLSIQWNNTDDFWRVFVPRSCLNRLTNRIKVKAEMSSRLTGTAGLAGWTAFINRG